MISWCSFKVMHHTSVQGVSHWWKWFLLGGESEFLVQYTTFAPSRNTVFPLIISLSNLWYPPMTLWSTTKGCSESLFYHDSNNTFCFSVPPRDTVSYSNAIKTYMLCSVLCYNIEQIFFLWLVGTSQTISTPVVCTACQRSPLYCAKSSFKSGKVRQVLQAQNRSQFSPTRMLM